MILSIRGTSGSGKTTAAKRVLHESTIYHQPIPHFLAKRKQPFYYTKEPVGDRRGIAILGHYESATGGCDTISGNDIPFQLIRELHDQYDVFFEGLLMAAEQHRTAKLHHDGYDVRLFYFNTTLQECLDGVNARRAARGNTTPVNPETTASRHRTLRLHPPRFQAMGVRVTLGGRGDAMRWLMECGVISIESTDAFDESQ